jgi:amino acid permease
MSSTNQAVEIASTEESSLIEQERDPAADDAKVGVASSRAVALNVFGIICYPLSIPYAFGRTGWYAGVVAFIYASTANYCGAYLLGDICIEKPNLTSYPAIAREAYGAAASIAVDSLQWAGFFMLAVYNIVLVGEYLSMTSWSDGLCQKEWMPIVVAALLVPAMIPSWNDLSWLATGFVAMAMGTVAILLDESIVDSYCERKYSHVTFFTVMQGITSMSFSFGGSSMFPEVIQEMANRKEFIARDGALNMAYKAVIPIYFVCGVVGFASFGNDCEGNVLLNYSHNVARKVSIGFMLFMLLFGILECNQLLSKKIEGRLGVHPTAWSAPPSSADSNPGLARGVVRSCLLGLQLLFALTFFNAGAGDIQSLTGALAGTPLSMAAPYLLHLKLLPDRFSVTTQTAMMGAAVVGFMVFVFGTVVAVYAIADSASSYELFGGECDAEDTVDSEARCKWW